MIDEQIRDGDVVVVERRHEARDGETVVALVRGAEATLKKFYRRGAQVVLEPANRRCARSSCRPRTSGSRRRARPAADLLGSRLRATLGPGMSDPIEQHVKAILAAIGEEPGRDGLERTPLRVAKAFRFLTKGYSEDPVELLNGALFDVSYDEMVLVKDIDFYSLCEHHLLPFFGRVHVAYIPNGRVVGLSKIPRLVEMFARRLQVQERLTMQIAEIDRESAGARGRRGRGRGHPPVHDDARRGAAERLRDHELAERRLPERPEDALRVHGADPAPQGELRLNRAASRS